MKYSVSLGVVLAAVWLLWSGLFHGLLLGLGLASVLAVVLLTHRMGLRDQETIPLGISLRVLLYAPWLLLEIFKSNVDVARRVLDPRLPIRTQLIRVRPTQRTDLGRVIFANSITLTPGTVSLDLSPDEVLVHALHDQAAAGLATGEMDRRVTRVEGQA